MNIDPEIKWKIIVMFEHNREPLHLTIEGYSVDITKNEDGTISFSVHAGIFGIQKITIPQAEWTQIVAYTSEK